MSQDFTMGPVVFLCPYCLEQISRRELIESELLGDTECSNCGAYCEWGRSTVGIVTKVDHAKGEVTIASEPEDKP